VKQRWKGPLASELSGIFQWVYGGPEKEEDIKSKILSRVPSLYEVERENEENLNPMLAWVREELTQGTGAYVGYKPEGGPKALIEGERRRALYPAYNQWCAKSTYRHYGPRRFSHDLLETLSKEGFMSEKVHREAGQFITGVVVKHEVYQRDHAYGAPIDRTFLEEAPVEQVEEAGLRNPGEMAGLLTTSYKHEAVPPKVWPPLDPYIYEKK